MRRVWFAAILCYVCAALFGYACAEEAPLAASARATPSSLIPGDTASVCIVALNAGDAAISSLSVTGAGGVVVAKDETLAPGETRVWTQKLTVSRRALLAGGAAYMLAYSINGKNQTLTVLAPLTRAGNAPSLAFSRELSSNYVERGADVTLTYRLRNDGDVPIAQIELSDELLGGRFETVDELAPGEGAVITRVASVTRRCVSAPTASFTAGGAVYSVAREPMSVYLAGSSLDMQLKADKTSVAPGSQVTLRLTLVNGSDETYERLEMRDSALGLFAALEDALNPGESRVFTKTVPLMQSTTFRLSAEIEDEDGEMTMIESNELTVFAVPDVKDARLTLAAALDEAQSGNGENVYRVTLVNEGKHELRNVRVFETSRGELRTLLSLAPGETAEVLAAYSEEDLEPFRFAATFADAEGDRLTLYTALLAQPEPEEPTLVRPTPTPSAGGQPAWIALSAVSTLALCIAVACVLLLRASARRNAKDQSKS